MNVIFLTMARLGDISEGGIYQDLLRKFRDESYEVYIVSPRERSTRLNTELVKKNHVYFLGVRTLNLQKTSIIEKGIGHVLVENQFKRAIRKYLPNVKFDLVLYSTPPVTFSKVIRFLRRQNPMAKTYLLLKDIFPQNAVDLGMMSKTGMKGLLYHFFRKKEKNLYCLSDFIGCMSPANIDYLLKHNPEIDPTRVELAPNSIELNIGNSELRECLKAQIDKVREKYKLPCDRPIFIYGGNLGRPQGIPFLIDCLEANSNRNDCHFVVVGTGTEFPKLKSWADERMPKNVSVLNGLPKENYDELVRVCDVGLIFLDNRFTIPNYPSRLLSYLENKIPILCATDSNTDIGYIAEENGYGFWCESNSVDAFTDILNKMINADRKTMGENGFEFLCKNYLTENTYKAIVKHLS